MPETKVKTPDGSIVTVRHPEGASQEDIFGFAQQQFKAKPPSGPDLASIPGWQQGGPSQTPNAPRGIMSRVGEGISQGFGESKVTPEERHQYPFLSSVKGAAEIPGRVAGAVGGGLAGLGAGAVEKAGAEPAMADRLMRDLGIVGTGLALEGGTGPKGPGPIGKVTERPKATPAPALPAPTRPPAGPGAPPVVKPEQSQLLAGIAREPYRDVASETQKALQIERGKKQAEVGAKYEETLEKPGEFASGSLGTTGQKIRSTLEQSSVPVDPQNTPASFAALKLLDTIPGFKPKKPADPMAKLTGVSQDVEGIKLNLRKVDEARKRLGTYWEGAQKNRTDRMVFGNIMEEFGKHVENVIAEGLFSGDPKVHEMLKTARQMSSAEKKLFGEKRRAGDDAGLALQKILKEGRSPEEISNYLYNANNTRLLDMIDTALGKDHPMMLKIKKGAWDHALETKNGVQKLVNNSTVSKKLFTGEEISLMRQYLMMKELPKMPKYKPPKPAELPPPPRDWKREMAVKIGAIVGGMAAAHAIPIPGMKGIAKAMTKKGIENRYLGTD